MMIKVHACGKTREYPEGTPLFTVAEEFQPEFQEDILLARVNGKLKELHKTLTKESQIEFLTFQDPVGKKTYERSAVFVMLKAFYDVIPREKIKKVQMDFALGNGIYGELEGDVALTEELLDRVKEEMHVLVEKKLPIVKRSVNTDEAVELFGRHGMHDKEQLFMYRRASRVNIYSIEKFEDYFYGYMVQNTGYVKYFDLIPYHSGFLLLLPETKAPRKVEKSGNHEKLFQVLRDSYRWSDCLGGPQCGNLKPADLGRKSGGSDPDAGSTPGKDHRQYCRAGQAKAGDKRLVMIAGPSSSGKTTFSHRLATQFRALGYTPHPIAVDNYFKNREDYPRDENGKLDMEALECVDIEKFNEDMNSLLDGKRVEIPRFNFVTGTREYNGDFLKLGKNDVLIIEGIHCLNDKLSYSLPAESRFKIYISALTQLNVDEHNRIPTADGRIIRRMVRDARTRGTSALETIRRWSSGAPGRG